MIRVTASPSASPSPSASVPHPAPEGGAGSGSAPAAGLSRTSHGPEVELARRLLTETREEISRADAKASVLLGMVSAVGGALIGVLAGQQWWPGQLSAPSRVLWWVGCAGWAAALVLLLAAVVPRNVRSPWRPGMPLSYFGDVRRTGGGAALREALREAAADPLPSLMAVLTVTSRIAVVKHRCVHTGVLCFAAATLLAPTAALLG